VAIVYVFPQVKRQVYYPLAHRFTETWRKFPPGNEPHILYVIGNGGEVLPQEQSLFDGISCRFLAHDNSGWDVGAFQLAAEKLPCDLLICLGAPVHFHRSGWLDRMVDAYVQSGPALYGCWAYLSPNWHVRTTVFWCPPELLKSYSYAVTSEQRSRYAFEHGQQSFTRHVLGLGFPCIMVTQKGCFSFDQWEKNAPGVADSLVLDQHIHA
jgi:hypothetical protein